MPDQDPGNHMVTRSEGIPHPTPRSLSQVVRGEKMWNPALPESQHPPSNLPQKGIRVEPGCPRVSRTSNIPKDSAPGHCSPISLVSLTPSSYQLPGTWQPNSRHVCVKSQRNLKSTVVQIRVPFLRVRDRLSITSCSTVTRQRKHPEVLEPFVECSHEPQSRQRP